MISRIKLVLVSAGSALGALVAGLASADYTTSTLASSVSPILDETVQSGLTVAIDFLTANLPLIITIGIAIGFVFWLVYKFKGALRGK